VGFVLAKVGETGVLIGEQLRIERGSMFGSLNGLAWRSPRGPGQAGGQVGSQHRVGERDTTTVTNLRQTVHPVRLQVAVEDDGIAPLGELDGRPRRSPADDAILVGGLG
jgi:hypothetical protein